MHDDAEFDDRDGEGSGGQGSPENGQGRLNQSDDAPAPFSSNDDAKVLTVFELLGCPAVRDVEEIPDSEIEQELDRLVGIMNRHRVAVDTVCDVEERELYRFITRELFLEPAGIIDDEFDMRRLFIYEEFHPNHEYDLINHTLDFVNSLFDQEKDWMPDFLGLAQTVNKSGGGVMPLTEVVRQLEMFRNAFTGFDVAEFGPVSATVAGHMAETVFRLRYTGCIEGGDDTVTFDGMGRLAFMDESGYWSICAIELPGITL